MLLILKDVFTNEGAKTAVHYELSLDDVEVDGICPFSSPIDVEAIAENHVGIITLFINVRFEYSRPCDRCFCDVTRELKFSFTHRLIESLEGDDDGDYIETPDFTIQLDELVASDILLELPVKFLCKQDCQGLCQKCGKNLNDGDCNCNISGTDPRLEALKELLN